MNVGRLGLLFALLLTLLQPAQADVPAPLGADQGGASRVRAPIGVIFDTDIWSDLDDVLALAMLHALEDRGEIDLLAVTISTNNRWCSSYVDLINTFYGRPSIPVGIIYEGMDIDVFRSKFSSISWPFTTFTQQVSERAYQDGRWVYPRRLGPDSEVPDAVTLLRKTLAAQPDDSVVLVQVGFSTNLARLLKSRPDASSKLDGRALVAKKVRLLTVMAGSFKEALHPKGISLPKGSPEFNLQADAASAQDLFANWPTQIVASGKEVGLALPYQPRVMERDYSHVPGHPIAESFRSFCNDVESTKQWSCALTHASSDLTAVLYAVRPDRGYFSLSSPGRIVVSEDGGSRFEESPTGRHRYLVLGEQQKERTLEAMMMLASQPPARAAQR